MTVYDLIEELKKYPGDTLVAYSDQNIFEPIGDVYPMKDSERFTETGRGNPHVNWIILTWNILN